MYMELHRVLGFSCTLPRTQRFCLAIAADENPFNLSCFTNHHNKDALHRLGEILALQVRKRALYLVSSQAAASEAK